MATAASRVRAVPEIRAGVSSIASLGWENLKWSVQSGEKIAGILCDTPLLLFNGIWLALLFGHKLNPGTQVLNSRTAWLPGDSFLHHLSGLLVYAGLTLLASASTDLYDRRKNLDGFSFGAIVKPVVLATTIFAVVLASFNVSYMYWLVVALMAALDAVGMATWRVLHLRLAASRATTGKRCRRALIIGARDKGRSLASYLEHHAVLGYTVKGFLDDEHAPGEASVLGPVSAFAQVIRSEYIDDVFITDGVPTELIPVLSEEAKACGIDVKVVPDICRDAISWQCVGDLPMMVIRSEPIPKVGLFLKRTFDILGASLGLIVVMPLLILIAILIRLDSRGPVLYSSWRVGRKGIPFRCFKFRTMSVDADAVKDALRARNQRVGPTFKVADDPRITRVGKWLRKYSLDELTQLLNVLRGDMSLVGPRPHPLDDYSQYELEHRLRLRVTPGLTGLLAG